LIALALGHLDRERPEGRPWLERAAAGFEALDDPARQSRALRYLASTHEVRGEFDAARRLRDRELALIRPVGDPNGLATALADSARLALYQDDVERAEREAREAWAIRWGGGWDRKFVIRDLLGYTLCGIGKFAEALAWAEEVLPIWEREMPARASYFLLIRAVALWHLGRYEEARESLESLAASGRPLISFARATLAFVLVGQGRHAEAERWGQEAVEKWRANMRRGLPWWIELAPGLAARGLGRAEEGAALLAFAARGQRRETILVAGEAAPWGPWDGLPWAALLACDQGRIELAAALWAGAARRPLVGNSRWFHDVVWRPIEAAAAATLGPWAIQEALARGRATDWAATRAAWLAELGV